MDPKLKALQEKVEKSRSTIAKVFEQAGEGCDFSKVTEFSGTDNEKSAALQKLSVDVEKMAKEAGDYENTIALKARNAKEIEDAKNNNRPPHPDPTKKNGEPASPQRLKTIGQAFVDAGGHLKENRGQPITLKGVSGPMHAKAVFSIGSDGWEPEIMRTDRMIPKAVRPIQILQLLPVIPTDENAYTYLEETVVTDTNVVEKNESDTFGESTLTVVRRSVAIEKIPVHIPVTDEQLADVVGVAAYLNNRLPEQIMRRADSQALNGTGVSPLLEGILQKSGRLSVTPEGADGIADVLLRAVVDIRLTGRALADAIVLHPTDWLTERLRKTKDGAYIWGNPDTVGIQSMWGLPIAQADSISQGTALVGDFGAYSAMIDRQEVEVLTGFVASQFIKGEQTVRATMRLAYVWYRAAAFAEVELPVNP